MFEPNSLYIAGCDPYNDREESRVAAFFIAPDGTILKHGTPGRQERERLFWNYIHEKDKLHIDTGIHT